MITVNLGSTFGNDFRKCQYCRLALDSPSRETNFLALIVWHDSRRYSRSRTCNTTVYLIVYIEGRVLASSARRSFPRRDTSVATTALSTRISSSPHPLVSVSALIEFYRTLITLITLINSYHSSSLIGTKYEDGDSIIRSTDRQSFQ